MITTRLGRLATLMLLLTAAALPAFAQFGKPHTKISVVLENSQVAPGQPVRGFFHMQMEGNWHTYWKNAGGVGLPTEVSWTLPEGWKADPLYWPAPHYINTSGQISYAYQHEARIPFILHPPSSAGGKVDIKTRLNWLECDESCVPAKTDISFPITFATSSNDSPEAAQVKAAFEALPKATEAVKAGKDGKAFALYFPTSLGDSEARFFPDSAGQITAGAPQTLSKVADGTLVLKLQPDAKAEKPPQELSGVLVVGKGEKAKSYEFKTKIETSRPSAEQEGGAPPTAASFATIAFTIGAAFLGGLVLNLMPCVFPVLSLKVLGIVEQADREGTKAWHHGAVFTLGVLVSFWVMSGLLLFVRSAGSEVGWGYQLQNPMMVAFLAALFLVIGLNLFGVFEVGENLTQLSNVADKKHGYAASFWGGVLTTVAATPCTAPFMGSAIGFALSQPAWVALLVFTSLALGVAAPYMTLTMFPALLKKLPRPGAWMVTFKQILAFPMLLAVVGLAWVFGGQTGSDGMAQLLLSLVVVGFACWIYGRWGNSYVDSTRRLGSAAALLVMLAAGGVGYAAANPSKEAEKWVAYSPALVDQLVAEGKPVFVDFTADWCTSCKANELVALSRPEVSQKFESLGVTLVKGDWTKRDEVIAAALAKYGRAGVPLYVLYPGQGREPIVLPEVLFPSTVLEALESVKKSS